MHESAQREAELRDLAQRIGIEMHDVDLFDRALTHASIFPEAAPDVADYEALEFLGDAVLGLAVAHHLFDTLPDRTPGEYSRLRAGLVNRRCVARVAVGLDIAPAIRLGRGEELSGGRSRSALLADCLEALIGALYLDSGYTAARAFIERAFAEELQAAEESAPMWDFKSRLQNYCQAERMALPAFTVVRAEGPDHQKEFEVEVALDGHPRGRGRGRTKKEAEQNAAQAALEAVGVALR